MVTLTVQLLACGALFIFLAIIIFARHRLLHESVNTVGADKHVRNITFKLKGIAEVNKTFENP